MKTMLCKCGQTIKLDDSDYAKVFGLIWQCNGTRIQHIWRDSGKSKHISMASYIMNDRSMYDHKDRNAHNMQRDNLRVATKSQNSQNRVLQRNSTTGYKGVSAIVSGGVIKYQAYIKKQGKKINLGTFLLCEDAAKAYDEAAKVHFGEFAVLNFP